MCLFDSTTNQMGRSKKRYRKIADHTNVVCDNSASSGDLLSVTGSMIRGNLRRQPMFTEVKRRTRIDSIDLHPMNSFHLLAGTRYPAWPCSSASTAARNAQSAASAWEYSSRSNQDHASTACRESHHHVCLGPELHDKPRSSDAY